MKVYSLAIAALAAFSGTILAQEKAPAPLAEVGLNYSLNRFSPGAGVPDFVAQGGMGSFEYNINRAVGVVSDFGVYRNGAAENLDTSTFTYLFGPRFNWRLSKVTPYVQGLAGGVRVSSSLVPTADGSTFRQSSFAMAFGGGMDIALTNHVSVKPFQVDYLMTQIPNLWGTNGVQNNLRYTAGVVLRFGSK